MLNMTLFFLIISLVLGLLGFGILAGVTGYIAKILFAISVIGFALTLLKSDDKRSSE